MGTPEPLPPQGGLSAISVLRLIGRLTAKRSAIGKDEDEKTVFYAATSVGRVTLTLGTSAVGYDYLFRGDGWAATVHVAYPITPNSLTISYENRGEALQNLVALALTYAED